MSGNTPAPEVTICVHGVTDVGAVRKNNEDTFLVADVTVGQAGLGHDLRKHAVGERGMLLLVSDGMGGAEAGEVASRLVSEHVSLELAGMAPERPAHDAIREAVERANLAVWEAAARLEKRGMGATLAAAWIRGRDAYVASVGDSRVYLLRSARIRQITRDQSMVESMIEAGVMTREEAETHPSRNMILQAMGVKPTVVVAIERVELRRGDMLLLCSDGLSGKISAEEMRDCVLTTPTVDEACRKMVRLAIERGGEDNVTVVLGELAGEGLLPTPLGERLTRTLEAVTRFDYKTGDRYAPAPPPKPTVPLGSEPPEKPRGS